MYINDYAGKALMNDIFIYLLPFPPSERALRFRDIMATAQPKMSVAEKLENAVQFKEDVFPDVDQVTLLVASN